MALLAKQWWRIIHNEGSLSFKVLQARYFPRTAPMKGLKGAKPSSLWNSLLEGKKFIEKGVVWRVGNGQ